MNRFSNSPIKINARIVTLVALVALVALTGFALGEAPKESDFYTITPFEAPEGHSVETGAIALLPGGKVAVCTRRGQIWTIENAFTHPERPAKWRIFAEYLHEPLGLAYRDGWLYAVQRPEVTRLKDEDGDGRADVFETVSDDWGINGNYHEYTFGSRFDKEGKHLVCTLFDRFLHCRFALSRLGPAGRRERQNGTHRLRGSFSGWNRIQCRGRCLLHRQPGGVERIEFSEVGQAGSFQGNPTGISGSNTPVKRSVHLHRIPTTTSKTGSRKPARRFPLSFRQRWFFLTGGSEILLRESSRT